MNTKSLLTGALAAALVFSAYGECQGDQPRLGFAGTLVRLPKGYGDLRGYRIDSVKQGSLAAAMGLERGDIIVYIGRTMAFTTEEAYRYALRQQGKTTKIGVINVRSGRLVWVTCPLNHDPAPHQDEPLPPGLILVDFGRTGAR